MTDSVEDVIITEDDCVDENRNIEEYVKAPASLDDGKIVTPLNSAVRYHDVDINLSFTK